MRRARVVVLSVMLAAACAGSPKNPSGWSGPATTPEEGFRRYPPPPAFEMQYVPPTPRETRLSNGMRIILFERHRLPLVAMNVVIPRGSADAPPGVAKLALDSFFAGTPTRDRTQLSRTLSLAGAARQSWLTRDAL